MTNKQVAEIATEAVKIYFDCNVSAREAIERAKEIEKTREKLAIAEQKLDYSYTTDDIEKNVLDIFEKEMELDFLYEKQQELGVIKDV